MPKRISNVTCPRTTSTIFYNKGHVIVTVVVQTGHRNTLRKLSMSNYDALNTSNGQYIRHSVFIKSKTYSKIDKYTRSFQFHIEKHLQLLPIGIGLKTSQEIGISGTAGSYILQSTGENRKSYYCNLNNAIWYVHLDPLNPNLWETSAVFPPPFIVNDINTGLPAILYH